MAAAQQVPAVGNVLGAIRAEADGPMLARAFVETADFKAITATQDFNFVVGRRGAGKTSLFLRASDYFGSAPETLLALVKPEEYEILELQNLLSERASDYRGFRSVSRVLWRAHLLLGALSTLLTYWKIQKNRYFDELSRLRDEKRALLDMRGLSLCSEILRRHVPSGTPPNLAPALIANAIRLEALQASVQSALEAAGKSIVVLMDGLDEGWFADAAATGLIGGLMSALSDIRERNSNIHGILFLRDNIFRAIAHFDADYSRHVEGSTLRLRWDESSLLHLVANRIRVVRAMETVESDVKIWNRFAQRDLSDREGFRRCLTHTLYRPRDLLVLLNQASVVASRSGRAEIVGDDITATAKQVSEDRLTDLLREYDSVLPGLDLFVRSFRRQPAIGSVGQTINHLDALIEANTYDSQAAGDFALLGSGAQILSALYGVGFVGLEDQSGRFVFCHDGAPSDFDRSEPARRSIIHPCYWQALDVSSDDFAVGDIVEIYDDPDATGAGAPAARDQRVRQIGQILEQLSAMPLGTDGWRQFEEWVFRTIRIVFSGTLTNPELKPNGAAIDRRDIVATNMAKNGFWKRVLDDYRARQVVIEVKNYAALSSDDVRQALAYSGNQYGQFVMIVTRSETDAPSAVERGYIHNAWAEKRVLLFIVPASLLALCTRKLRNVGRFDYVEKAFNRRLDVFQRSYLAGRHIHARGSDGDQ